MLKIKMCPFKKVVIKSSYIDHEEKDINVPLMDSLYIKTEEKFTECIGNDCTMFISTFSGGRCGLVNYHA